MRNDFFNVTAIESKAGEHGLLTGGWRAVGTFGVTDSENEASAFNITYDSLSGRGDFYQGFDCHDRAHLKGLSITDNMLASSRLNFTFNTSTGVGKVDKKVEFEDGLTSSGDIEINGVTAISEVTTGTFSMNDNDSHTETFDYPLSLNFFEVKLHAVTATKDSYIIMRVMKRGTSHVVEIGDVFGEEFPVYAQYDVVESASSQKHSVKFIGFGTGDAITYSYKAEKPFNDL